ncbi:MAG: isoleucine--tRNA ligase [Bacteroidetes bacterium]|nr:isoleucine--tRNA ligase [Bacteroidota bacterium]
MKYPEYQNLDLVAAAKEILDFWQDEKIFEKSVSNRNGATPFVFYEGPPSANGMPGIHHVMARTIKDLFCRYKTLQGYQVVRKGGWDTHGLPIELSVEKTLGIRKDDIGKTISIEDYNKACRKEVMKYKNVWDDLTRKMGYWVDLDDPYITFNTDYIETCWHLLKMLFEKNLLYKGYTIQPYSPAAGTGLSSHELNQPGTYKDVKDTTAVAMFKVVENDKNKFLYDIGNRVDETAGIVVGSLERKDVFFVAWTTTPWTLPSNTALAVGESISYLLVDTINQYTNKPILVIVAKKVFGKYFQIENESEIQVGKWRWGLVDSNQTIKKGPIVFWNIKGEFKGKELEGIKYEQLLPYAQPEDGDNFRVVIGDFVTTEDGTGIVHLAPSFGADDFRTAKQNGIGSLTLVDKRGRFTEEVTDFANEFVKEQYLTDEEKETERQKQGGEKYLSVDERIAIKLKKENKAFKVEKYEHTYPHCWRTDKPILYYPLDSWFIKTTAAKDRLVELNKTINWKPESTGTGRFGNWLENLVDWNLSRSRYWGIPLPIWVTEDKEERICIGSVAELNTEIEKAIQAVFMTKSPYEGVAEPDLHRPYVDDIFLVSASGKKMLREPDLIDVWFDSGAMPYAQLHYPFENKNLIDSKVAFPADFIAEGVDQTRGWFFTLHAIGVLLFDSVAFKNVVSNGLVLDKNGNKMSKRLGNTVDPFETIDKYGIDATRWYMVYNAPPWDNLKFDIEGVDEVRRKFFGTLYNIYSFFGLYANIDGFAFKENRIPFHEKPEIDRWIISLLNNLVKEVETNLDNYDPTPAVRAIHDFVVDNLSNWYVRLCRRRFWKGEYTADKISAYQTLYECMETVSILAAPFAPFYMDKLFRDLNIVTGRLDVASVHLADFPKSNPDEIDVDLEERMWMAQEISSMALSLRKRSKIRVRQPLNKILIPIFNPAMKLHLEAVKEIILSEINVKTMEYVDDSSGLVKKKIKPDFKKLGGKYGKKMKEIQQAVSLLTPADISLLEANGSMNLNLGDEVVSVLVDEMEILSEDIPGWFVESKGKLTVALDITLTEDLKNEGLARELVNRIQNLRKSKGFDVTDHISVSVQNSPELSEAIKQFKMYICDEILADELTLVDALNGEAETVEIEEISTKILVNKR